MRVIARSTWWREGTGITNKSQAQIIHSLQYTLPETNMSPENLCLEDVFPIEIVSF